MISFFWRVAEVSITTSFVIGVMLMINRVLGKRYSIRWMQFIWLLLIIRLLLPANVIRIAVPEKVTTLNTIVKNVEKQKTVHKENLKSRIQQGNMSEKSDKANDQPSVIQESFIVKSSNNFARIVAVIRCVCYFVSLVWFAGAVLLLLQYFITYMIFAKRLQRENVIVKNPEWQECFRRINKKQKKIMLYCNETVKSPFSMGIWNKEIVIPKKDYCLEEIEAILRHEYTLLYYVY